MRAHKRLARPLAVGLVLVALSAASVAAAAGNRSATQPTNYRGPAQQLPSGGGQAKLPGPVNGNPSATNPVKSSNATRYQPVMNNNPALAQGGNSN